MLRLSDYLTVTLKIVSYLFTCNWLIDEDVNYDIN